MEGPTPPRLGSTWRLNGQEAVVTVTRRPHLGRPTNEDKGLVWIVDKDNTVPESMALGEFTRCYSPVVRSTSTRGPTVNMSLRLDPRLYAALVGLAGPVPVHEYAASLLEYAAAPAMVGANA